MNLIDFVYRLIEKFVPITSSQVTALELEARAWWNSEKVNQSKIGIWVKQYAEEWWFKTALAIAFIFIGKALMEFVNNKPEEEHRN